MSSGGSGARAPDVRGSLALVDASSDARAAAASHLSRIARLDALAGDGPHSVAVQGTELVLLRTASGIRAFEGRCPHQGALLAEGELDGTELVCRNHGWRFDVETGARRGGPECLASCPVIEREGALYVDVASLRRSPAKRAARASAPRRQLGDLPGPRGLPLLGNAHQLELGRLHLVLERWASEYGAQYVFRMGSRRVLTLSDRASCEQVLRARPEAFTRHGAIARVFAEVGADGVGSAEGDAWRPQRRLVMQALAQRHLRGFYPQLRLVGERLLRRWERFADAGSAIDIIEELKRFTVDVTTLVTFGHDVNTVEGGDDVIQRQLELIFPAFNRRVFALLPTWRILRSPSDRRLDRAVAEIRRWLEQLVSRERARLAAEPELAERPTNFLQAMLSARDGEGRPFSEQVIFGNLMTMLLAGEDTTANTLAWTIHELCQAPQHVAEVQREADRLLGAARIAPDFDAIQQLSWAGAVVNEAMRLHPVGPVMMFDSTVDTTIGDVHVPEGTRVALLVRPPSVSERHFVDARRFAPQRWLAAGAGAAGAGAAGAGAHDPAAHFPFGSGPRICPGRSLAMLELQLLVSLLYRNFDVERTGAADAVRERFAFTLTPAGLGVRLRRRSLS
ncbi:MAG TPA: cytochrome P450 [Polyangiaceae bacterium]|nr:cytochrome P450 [Polyangiaceae bacterium]